MNKDAEIGLDFEHSEENGAEFDTVILDEWVLEEAPKTMSKSTEKKAKTIKSGKDTEPVDEYMITGEEQGIKNGI